MESRWDGKFTCALYMINVAFAVEVMQYLEPRFPTRWTHTQSAPAQGALGALFVSIGSLREEQFLGVGESVAGVTPWVFWAPWSDRVTISVRMGLLDATVSLIEQFRIHVLAAPV